MGSARRNRSATCNDSKAGNSGSVNPCTQKMGTRPAAGLVMGATSMNLPCIYVPAGPMLRGHWRESTLGSGSVWVFSAALLQTIVPDQVRGRVFAFEFAFLTLTQSISIFWAGQAMDRFGLGPQAVMGEMAVLSVFVGILWLVFHLRNLNRPAVALESD